MNLVVRIGIGLAIVGAGVGTFVHLVNTKPTAKKSVLTAIGTAVEVEDVAQTSSRITVRARGTVIPARIVVLGTEVAGKVISVAENLQPGGKFSKNEIIARVDPADYRLAVEQQFALVDTAAAQLQVEESRRAVAKREWEMFGSKRQGNANKHLALREPQLRSVTTRLKSAKSGLRRARLSVERTLLRAPFDGMVQERTVDLGQIVAPGSPLLTFVGTRNYWVQISVPVERLIWILVPGVNTEGEGSKVVIRHRIGESFLEKSGRVLRLLSNVDPAGHMARLLIEVHDPLGLSASKSYTDTLGSEAPSNAMALPLLLGSFVEVEIEGRAAQNVVELARSSLRGGDEVYLFNSDSRLEKRKVQILWREKGKVLLSGGLAIGEKVIVSPLAAAVPGMKLRLPGTKKISNTGPKTPALKTGVSVSPKEAERAGATL